MILETKKINFFDVLQIALCKLITFNRIADNAKKKLADIEDFQILAEVLLVQFFDFKVKFECY